MIARKLNPGDEIRVIAPSRNLTEVWPVAHHHAMDFWRSEGFNVTFSRHCNEADAFHSSSIASRVEDLHEAFLDPNVKMVVSCLGGFNANQLLPHIDYDLIAKHPKILCGYSDVTVLLNAIHARTGLVTYHGPHFSTFGFGKDNAYTSKHLFSCVMSDKPFPITPSEAAGQYHILQEGACRGAIIGGNLCTLNLLQGTPYMPDLRDKVLFLEDDNIMGDYFCYEFDRNLASLLQVTGAEAIRGIVFGRFDESCGMSPETMAAIIRDKVPAGIPVVFGVDFGHVFPIITLPIGGSVSICARCGKIDITIESH